MTDTRIKISSVVASQLPNFVKEEFPLVSEFLSQYYLSLEGQGSTSDILQNVDQYVKVDNLTNLKDSTVLSSDVTFSDSEIFVESTYGFPQSYGLIQIDSEIITYTSITANSFVGCVRGFSGVTSYRNSNKPDQLVFSESEISQHSSGTTVNNLSVLFLKEFFKKVKTQVTPGFEDRELYSGIDKRIFIKQSSDFYSTKGADQSFEILFRALYGEDVEVIKPRDYLINPSDAQYRVTRDLVVESLSGNPEDLLNRTLFQDQTENFPAASGSVTNVQKISRDQKEYYVLSLDFDYDKDINVRGSVFGKFSIHPSTKLITSVSANATTLDVDSTVGFPNSGTLVVDYSDGTSLTFTYESKTLNQFFGCSGITRTITSGQDIRLDAYAYGYSGLDTSNVVTVRVTGVLSDLEIPPSTHYYEEGDIVESKILGIGITDYVANNWFFNIATSYDVRSISLQELSSFTYNLRTFDRHNFVVGDNAKITGSDGSEKTCKVVLIVNENAISVRGQGQLNNQVKYNIEKILSKVNSNNYPELSIYTTNVQNVYTDNESLYVASPSIPNYLDESLNINNRSITFSGTFNGENITSVNHGFCTGDSVTYRSVSDTNKLNIDDGIYFIKRVDENTIKLSLSKSNIYNGKYVTLTGTVSNNILEYTSFANQNLEPQKLLRKVSSPVNDDIEYETRPGLTGILVNGVEILNYKSNDTIFYGPLQNVDVTSGGSGYDVINPPVLQISDQIGNGFSGHCEVDGVLERIDVVDGGFDYLDEPVITITGGNGSGAAAKANLISINHSIDFNASSPDQVDLSTDVITFSNYHKFRDGENVIYKTNESTSVGGLSTFSSYYTSVQDDYSIKLHNTYADAISRTNAIDLTSYGTGNHTFNVRNEKKIIGSVTVSNSGTGYKNRKTTVTSSGINTASNIITIENHKYQSGEVVYYTPGTTPIGGISTGSYYVTKVDDNNFKLSQVGVGTTSADFYYRNKNYLNLTSSGSGTQIFNYPEIQVTVSGKIGVSTFTQQSFSAILQPVFRGEVTSVFIENGGIGYGSSEILNYNRQPSFNLNSGSGGQIKPIISNGRIVDAVVLNSGSGYNSPPNIEVFGSGQSALLTPVITDGSITSVKVVSGGVGYTTSSTSLNVVSSGSGAKFEFTSKKWTVNLFERLLQNNQITNDDGVITKGTNQSFGLQYSHLYSPRKLRQSVFGTKIVNGERVFTQDLTLVNGRESTSTSHSPIIGWAYDGNPIYGPYGYTSLIGGSVRLMKSGYELNISSDRPNPLDSNGNVVYPEGYFVEDFEHTKVGDLDEYNGRFCVTPEFPNGVYAYFTTINPDSLDSSSAFRNYRRPEFPYFIGNKFKSKPDEYNTDRYSNQDDIDLQQSILIRNTTPYNLLSDTTYYDYIVDPNKIQKQNTEIINTSSGGVDFIGIETGGTNYKVNDVVGFDNDDTEGFGARAVVSTVLGKDITQVSIATSSFTDVELYPQNDYLVGLSTVPHNYLNNDIVTVTTKYDYRKSSNIIVNTNVLSLRTGIGSTSVTGIVTYFNVSGSLSMRENDVYEIGDEQVKILNIDRESFRVRVLRNHNNTSGLTSYASGDFLVEKPRRFQIDFPISGTYNFVSNKELYFDPKESVGLGTTAGVGIVSTIYFSNPGVGLTQITIPTQSIYIRNHGLKTGDSLIYSSNGGTPISISTDGYTTYQLSDETTVYAAKINDDLIGISTFKVGLGSTGGFVGVGTISTGILYFNSIGGGEIHSFTTNYENTLKGEVSKNVVTVSTAQTHGLLPLDIVNLTVKPGISTTVFVKYDDYNRRMLINARAFTTIDTSEDTILIENHGYYTGQKVLYTSGSPAGGLNNNQIYYVVVVSTSKIKLSESYYQALKSDPEVIDITSSTSGTISEINPSINLERNQVVNFDLSDSSLSFIDNSISYSAFDFNLYSDKDFKDLFYTTQTNNVFEVTKSGRVGIDTNAYLQLRVNDNIPQNLYYNLDPINLDINSDVKKSIIVDSEVENNNTLVLVNNVLNGTHTISGIGTTTFSFSVLNKPSESSYSSTNNDLRYTTNSRNALGSISSIVVTSPGRNYKKLPGISSVSSTYGSGAILLPNSNSIGKVLKVNIQDIGFDYLVDTTLRPQSQFPQILKLEPFSTFERIGITSVGTNYLIAPDLIVLDGLTNNRVLDVDLRYELGDSEVTILENTKSLNDKTPIIIPTNNTNGITISSISFNDTTKDVTVSLGVSFSSINDFPFNVGDRVLVENVSVGVGTTDKGYNSSNYDYSLFTVTQRDPNIGGSNASITYNLTNYLTNGEVPGTYDPVNSSGMVTPEKYFPIFDITLAKNQFFKGETVVSNSASGIVNSWDSKNGYLKVSSIETFENGTLIKGSSSNSEATISNVIEFDSHYNVDSSSIVDKGWNRETGFLNNNIQRIHDNDYYQYFSYAIRSKVQYEDWNNAVSSLNHTSGFKKFSDLVVESIDLDNVGINTDQNLGDFIGISDLVSVVDLNCVNDFDLATERTLSIDSKTYSDEIVFNSKTLQDYIESVGNRVLMIDDISGDFNSNPRSTRFSVVGLFDLATARSKKYITYTIDKRFTGERQILLVSLLHNDSVGFLNQYGRVETEVDLGSFDFSISGTEGQLLFYPTKYSVNDYNVNSVSYCINDSISGIGSTDLGDTVRIESSTATIPVGFSTTTTIVGIASTYRTSKVLVQYGAVDNSYFEYDELTVIHNGSEVELIEYGQLSTDSLGPFGSSGLGTYSAYLSGSNLNIDFTPNTGLGVTFNVNTLRVSIADTSSTGVSTSLLNTGILDSRITSIASSTSPVANTVATYSKPYSGAYYLVSIEDTTNNEYQVSEVVVADDSSVPSWTEFGILQTGSNLGDFDATIVSGETRLTFTPIANSDVQVRVFQNALRLVDTTSTSTIIDLDNASIQTGYGSYEGTDADVRRTFGLTHKQNPIFKRDFVGSASTVVNLTDNLIKIPNHFFVTGEELTYRHAGAGTTQAIGIVTTSIVGIGTTDKLPSTVYAIKVDDLSIRLASSAENALKTVPVSLTLSSVGIGTSHSFTSKKQNSKVLINIDNVVQSPIVSTAITTTLADEIFITDDIIKFTGITSFFGGDLIQINNEIMRIESVGLGSTNSILVRRPWMGTGISSHANGSLITKVNGDYNIVDNTINFITAPYGPVPIGTTTGSPNDVDYLGISTNSTFSGRTFLRSGVPNTSVEPYTDNYIFDDISTQFTGYSTSFTLTSSGSSVTGISTDNAIVLVNQIFQGPQRIGSLVNINGDYDLIENVGITSIQFTGSISSTSYDINTANVPLGGVIVSVASSSGLGYQPLVSAGGTAVVSGLGTISSISIGNSGSGYRSGSQVVRVGVQTESLDSTNITYVGIASVSGGNIVSVAITNPGVGYTISNPPIVVFDEPLSYSDIPLVYSSSSVSGFGTGATVNVVVGQGSSVIDFEITNLGYGYGQGEILTVGVGGTVGIPTDTSLSFEEFQITVDRTYSDSFAGWSIGNLLVIDPLDSLFDGVKVSFPIKIDGAQKTIRAKTGSLIDVQATLLVFINDILQVPGQGYIFNGGSYITFTEAPKVGDVSKILFYQGTSSVDVLDVDILETIKVGDEVRLNDDNLRFKEDDRVVFRINSTDSIDTNVYPGPGISLDENYERPVIWCKQTEDKFIDGSSVAKDRVLYEPLIYPTSTIINPVGVGSTMIFVESVKTFFDSDKENSTKQNEIIIISQDSLVSASATAVVSSGGTISSIVISDGGLGYVSAPSVTISNPVGLGTSQRATATSTISIDGSVTSINLTYPGVGYTNTNPPQVLIEQPKIVYETNSSISYVGDFGTIVGFGTTTIGSQNRFIFDLYIPQDSYLRDASIVSTAVTVSSLSVGDYFVVKDSNVGLASTSITSLRFDGSSIIGIGTQFVDNVYQVVSSSVEEVSIPGIGTTGVTRVFANIDQFSGDTFSSTFISFDSTTYTFDGSGGSYTVYSGGISTSNSFGSYSWGRITLSDRVESQTFNFYGLRGVGGISTSAIVRRTSPLKYNNYL